MKNTKISWYESKTLFRASLVMAFLGFIFTAWISSTGSMVTYNLTSSMPVPVEPCNYLLNIDDPHHHRLYLMLGGAEKKDYEQTVMARRILFFVLAYPFVKQFGYLEGGVPASLLLSAFCYILFVIFIRKNIGKQSGYAALVLLFSYPGAYYWIGLPYAYAAIFPCLLLSGMLFYSISQSDKLWANLLKVLALGTLCLGYDLLIYCLIIVPIIFLSKAQYKMIFYSLFLLILPMFCWSLILKYIYELPIVNYNTITYWRILEGYLTLNSWEAWTTWFSYIITNAIPNFFKTFFYANFFILSILLLLIMAVRYAQTQKWASLKLYPYEYSVLIAVFFLYWGINSAPVIWEWDLRGAGYARFYQIILIPTLFIILRFFQRISEENALWAKKLLGASVLLLLFNFSICIGAITENPLAGFVYHKFYSHSEEKYFLYNLKRFGRQPLGICNWHFLRPYKEMLGISSK